MAFDTNAGRNYLANVPGLQFAKPIAELSPGYVRRLATQLQRQERAGAPLSRQAARGHVLTPEHGPAGGRPRLPAPAAEYQAAKAPKRTSGRIGHNRPANVPERQAFSDGSIATTHTAEAEALRMLRFYAGQDMRVVVTGFDCSTRVYRSLGVNAGHLRGWNVDDLLRAFLDWRAVTGGSFTDWFIHLANSTDSDPNQAAIGLSHVCFWQIFAYPVNRHLSAARFAR